ncbi:MAG: DNA-3-methyladenine glycosylase [Oscillospiraceae bacterium]|nr:DNA-3-methyladenine glycosylase [Oscillospiraceae bacterium]
MDINIIETENPGGFNFDLTQTFECGQYLNFNKLGENDFETSSYGKYLRIYQENNRIYFETSREDFENTWRKFFDFDTDYKKIYDTIKSRAEKNGDENLLNAAKYCSGIRILRQNPFECLISFIISQNNNIPRIRKIIGRLCENHGEKIHGNYHAFPDCKTIANLTPGDLAVIKAGFREKYILDAAKKINSGEINLDLIYSLDTAEAVEYLKRIKGVGDKVASCVLLFGYNKLDAFPVDVWIKKTLAKYYPEDFRNLDYKKYFGEYAGVANAYLFYYEREKNKK